METKNNLEDKGQIARLLDRNSQIQMAQEWDQVQNNYASLKKRINRDRTDYEAALKLVLLYTQEARITGEHGYYYPAAMDILNGVLDKKEQLNSDNLFFALSLKSGVLMSLHHFEEALTTAESAIDINKYNAQIYGILVDANVELGNYEAAVEAADHMVSIRPDLRSYARISYLRQIFGDLDGAIDAMQMAVTAGYPPYEETAWARYQLAKLYELKNEISVARSQYEQILIDRPGYPFAIAAIANLEKNAGNTDQALIYYDQAIEAIPEVSFYVDKAKIFYELGKVEQADKVMSEVFLMLEEDQNSGHNMDLFYSEIYSEIANDQKQALQYALKEYNIRPNNIEVNKHLAMIYAKMGDLGNVKKHLKIALRTNTQDPDLMSLQIELKNIES